MVHKYCVNNYLHQMFAKTTTKINVQNYHSNNRSSHPEVFCKKSVLKNSQKSQENTCDGISF